MSIVPGIFTLFKRLIRLCLQSLHHRYAAAKDPDRPFQEQVRTGRRKCPAASATHYSSATGETTYLYQDGSHAPGASGKHSADLETGSIHRSARDAPAVASPGLQTLLEV